MSTSGVSAATELFKKKNSFWFVHRRLITAPYSFLFTDAPSDSAAVINACAAGVSLSSTVSEEVLF